MKVTEGADVVNLNPSLEGPTGPGGSSYWTAAVAPRHPVGVESRKARPRCWPPVTSSSSQFHPCVSVALWRLSPLLWF